MYQGRIWVPPTLVKSVKALFLKKMIRNVEFKYNYLKQFQMIQLLFQVDINSVVIL